MKWWGLSAPLHGACKAHFLQFSGLVGAWDLVWSAVIWTIWFTRNSLIFKGKKLELSETVEQVKLKSWLWISATKSQMLYPVSCWFNNPRGCLGLSGGVELVWFRFAVGGKVRCCVLGCWGSTRR